MGHMDPQFFGECVPRCHNEVNASKTHIGLTHGLARLQSYHSVRCFIDVEYTIWC